MELLERHEFRQKITIEINGEKVFDVFDSECTEDANMTRNFADVEKIPKILRRVIEALNKEAITVREIEEEEDF